MSEETTIYPPSKCAWCGGTGEWNVAPGLCTSCIVCGGKGNVSVAQPRFYAANATAKAESARQLPA